MQSISNATFGPLIAYLVPGLTLLLGLSPFSATLRAWLSGAPSNAPTIGGFLYLTVASLAAGMVVSALRWVLVDSLLAWMGVRRPKLNFARLATRVEAFSLLIEIHYRHYQFYANMFVATALAYGCYRFAHWGTPPPWLTDIGFVALEAVFLMTSRDTLRRYYDRTGQLLAGPNSRRHGRTSSGV